MKSRKAQIIFAAVVLLLVVGIWRGLPSGKKPGPVPIGALSGVPEGEGWRNLFDAEHRGNWKNINDEKEIFEFTDDDELHIFGRTRSPLRYVGYAGEEFGDFELYVQVMVTPGTNSGIFVRAQGTDKVYRGFEIQVQDDHGDPPNKNSSGSVYDVVTPMFNMAFPAGEWNSYRIRVVQDDVQIFMNGWKIIHTNLSKMVTPLGKFEVAYRDIPKQGMLTFQDHGGEVWYRNIRILMLGKVGDAEESS